MAISFNKKEREKKRQKKKRDKQYAREQKKDNPLNPPEFMYVGLDGNLTTQPPDPALRQSVDIEDIDISTPSSVKSEGSKFSKTGTVKFFNIEKGYGFIEESTTRESFFVHVDNLEEPIKEGDRVSFETGKGPKGPVAVSVKVAA